MCKFISSHAKLTQNQKSHLLINTKYLYIIEQSVHTFYIFAIAKIFIKNLF